MKVRKLDLKDAPLMIEWMHDKSVVENLRTDFESKTIFDCEKFILDAQQNCESLHLAIVDDNDEYMGTVSLKHIKDNSAEFGIAVRQKAMGKGYAKSGMEEIIKIGAEMGLKNIYWCVDPENARALKFYDKNGYKRVSSNSVIMCVWGGYSPEEVSRYIWYQI